MKRKGYAGMGGRSSPQGLSGCKGSVGNVIGGSVDTVLLVKAGVVG